MEIDKDLIDKLLADYKGPEDLIGEKGLLKQLTKALVERDQTSRAASMKRAVSMERPHRVNRFRFLRFLVQLPIPQLTPKLTLTAG